MATFTKTVDPNGSADYLSLALWEAGEQTLYSTGDIAIADCKRTGALKDDGGVDVNGWTAGVIPKVIVNSAHRHEGKKADTRVSDGNYIYKLEAEFDALTLKINSAEVHYLTVTNWGRSTGDRFAIGTPNANDFCVVANCLIYDPADNANNKSGIQLVNGNSAWHIYNNIVFDVKTPLGTAIGIRCGRDNLVYNNTVYNCGTGFTEVDSNNTMIYKNNISVGNNVADYDGGFSASSSNNVSSDGTAPGTTPATLKTDYATYFVDHLNGDFHITDTSETLFGIASADLSATFTDDIDSDTRPASSAFGLGADFYVSAGGGITGTGSHQATSATHAATGERLVTGAASHASSAATHSASGEVSGQITGSASHQAQNSTHTAIGERSIEGTAAHQAITASQASSGTVGSVISGAGAHQSQTATHSATGERLISSVSSHQANTSTQSATGERRLTGSAIHSASTATQDSSGSVGNVVSGTGAHAANDATQTAIGLRIVGGTATHQANTSTHTASGTAQGAISGSASHQAARATHEATGLRLISGSANHQASTATQAASDIPLVEIPLGVRGISDLTPVRGILDTTPNYGILKLG